MDGWMDGWMDRWMDGWMDGQTDRPTGRQAGGWMETKKNEDNKEGINEIKEKKGGRKQEWNQQRNKYGTVYGRNKEENNAKGRRK